MGKVALLYTSHFLSAWNSRVFQFGSVLFLATLFPGTLLPVSVYALSSVLPGALWAGKFGSYIDTHNRLSVVRQSIIGQRLAVVLACLLFLFPSRSMATMLALLAGLGGAENSWSIVNTVSVERDWVIVVAGDDRELLGELNARMRFIDLACKLLGPAFIGFVDSWDHRYAIIAVLGMSVVSCGVEYWAIARVYRAVPELAAKGAPALDAAIRDEEGGRLHLPEASVNGPQSTTGPAPATPAAGQAISTPRAGQASRAGQATDRTSLLQKFSFWKHPLMPVSIAECLTYITVLAFSGQMIAFLIASGMPIETITWFRTGSVAIELSATLLAPIVIRKTGPLRSACAFIDYQWATLVVTAILFANASNPLAATILSVGVAVSRIGLWGFDLSSQIIVQDGVEESIRGRYSAYEKSLQNWCMICLFLFTMVFHDPHLFVYPVMLSVTTTGMTMLLMNYFMYTRKA